MKHTTRVAFLLATSLTATPAFAQTSDISALRAEIEQLQRQVTVLNTRLEQLESSPEQENAVPVAPPAATPTTDSADAVEISMGGAPEIEAPGGWSFKPFGRVMADAGFTSLPEGADGFGSEMRRARIGVSGDIPGGFGYKIEVDFAGGSSELTDAIITYDTGDVTLTAGQHNTFQSLEELTSSRWSSFIERAAFTDAFGFERRLGVSAQYASGDVLVQAGLFSDNITDLPGKSWSADGRVVYAPRIGNTQLHLGGSLHHADLESGSTLRYRQRPLVHFTSERLVDTGTIGADSELGAGLEAALIAGPFHAAGETYWQSMNRPGLQVDPTFFGGYAELGYYLTQGDSRRYKGGKFDRTRPVRTIDEGGPGAIQVVVRYDHLDLNSGTITGGKQNGYFASLVWVPTDYTRLMLNYGRLEYTDAVRALANGDTSYGADVMGMRAQIDF